jgi:hypothetical protein
MHASKDLMWWVKEEIFWVGMRSDQVNKAIVPLASPSAAWRRRSDGLPGHFVPRANMEWHSSWPCSSWHDMTHLPLVSWQTQLNWVVLDQAHARLSVWLSYRTKPKRGDTPSCMQFDWKRQHTHGCINDGKATTLPSTMISSPPTSMLPPNDVV